MVFQTKELQEYVKDAYVKAATMLELYESPRVERVMNKDAHVFLNFLGEGSSVELNKDDYLKLREFIKSVDERNKKASMLEAEEPIVTLDVKNVKYLGSLAIGKTFVRLNDYRKNPDRLDIYKVYPNDGNAAGSVNCMKMRGGSMCGFHKNTEVLTYE